MIVLVVTVMAVVIMAVGSIEHSLGTGRCAKCVVSVMSFGVYKSSVRVNNIFIPVAESRV